MVDVPPFDDLVYEDSRNVSEESESEDSNCEGYYKNDYPDLEDDYAYNMVDVDDIRDAVFVSFRSFDDDEGDGSTSDENDSIDSEDIGFEDDIVYCNMHRYWKAYARYKARILKKKPKNRDSDNETSDEDDDSD